MSGDLNGLSKAEIKSLTGQIVAKLDAADGNADGKIKGSIWKDFFGEGSEREGFAPKHEDALPEDEIDLKTAFDAIMKRIFNAAKQAVGATGWQDDDGTLTQSAQDKINAVAKDWLGKAEEIGATEEDGKVKEEKVVDDPDAEAKQALGEAEEAAGEIKTSMTNMAPQIGVVMNRLNAARVTEGRTKEEVEAEKASIQKQIDKLKQQVASAKQNIEALKENIKDKTEVEGYTDAKQAIDAAEASIKSKEETITKLEQALAEIKTDGLKTKEQLTAEKIETTKKDLVENKKAKPHKRVINGQPDQEYYMYKDADGTTHRVIIDNEGNPQELVIISDSALTDKQFVTASLLSEATKPNSITSLPEGVKCECTLKEGKPELKFTGADGTEIEPAKVKEYKAPEKAKKKDKSATKYELNDEFRAKIKEMRTGVTQLQEFNVESETKASINYNLPIGDNEFSNHHKMQTEKGADNRYHQGPYSAISLNLLREVYSQKTRILANNTAVYQELAKKPEEELTPIEKAFMADTERRLLEFFNAE